MNDLVILFFVAQIGRVARDFSHRLLPGWLPHFNPNKLISKQKNI
jgi:hypothetical protein